MKRLDEILKRCEAATPGPWGPWIAPQDVGRIAHSFDQNDAEFISHARTDLPLVTQALMKAVDGLKRD